MTSFFDIAVDRSPDPGNPNGRLGVIRIGDWQERFDLALGYWSPQEYETKWREALVRLVAGSQSVGLMSWMSSPRHESIRRAWILYREQQTVYIQDRLFVGPQHKAVFDEAEHLVSIGPRETVADDGSRISEWKTDLAAIQAFLKRTESSL